jgi:hypothetical protein
MDNAPIEKILGDLTETLAKIEHERWSHWQRYLHSQCIPQGAGGALLIPAHLALKWERQTHTPYAELSDSEKDSDREQVRNYLPIIIDAVRRNCRC